jgi:hypothetical protein
MKNWAVFLTWCVLFVAAAPETTSAQERFGIHLFGLSYHYDSRTYLDEHGATQRYNQVNVGLGVRFVARERKKSEFSVEAGAYRDSKRNTNVWGGPIWRFKFTESLRAGVGLVGLSSKTYAVPVAPLPVVTYKYHRLSLNATWIPSLSERESSAIAYFATVHF